MWNMSSTVLRKARVQAKLSQRAVSEFLDYKSPQFVSNWERGISRPPDTRLRELAELFQIPLSRIVNAISDDMTDETTRWRSQFTRSRK